MLWCTCVKDKDHLLYGFFFMLNKRKHGYIHWLKNIYIAGSYNNIIIIIGKWFNDNILIVEQTLVFISSEMF